MVCYLLFINKKRKKASDRKSRWLLRPMQWYQWEQRYHALTPKQVAFLILQYELHSTDDQIALGITESTVRVVRSRIKRREK